MQSSKVKGGDILFSIVIPLFNKGEYIRQTLFSVLSQTYANLEIIVVDDGSTDGGDVVVRSICDNRLKYFFQENKGVSSARNYGVKKASGEWILFLDADDNLLPNAIEKMRDVVISYQGHLDVVAGNFVKVTNGIKYVQSNSSYRGIVPDNFKWQFFNKFFSRIGCTIIRKEIFDTDLFNDSLSRFEDCEFEMRVLKKSKVFTIPDIVLEHNCDRASLSKPVSDFSRDFTFSLDFVNKSFWEKCIMGELLFFATFSYPLQTRELKKQYGKYYFYSYIANYLKKIRKLYCLIFMKLKS